MNDAKLKNLALAAVIGLFVGACAHQESNQISGMENDEGAASAETASLGDSLGDTGTSSNGEVPSEMAPLPASSTEGGTQASTETMDNLAGVASTEAMPTENISPEGPSAEVAAAASPEAPATLEPTLVGAAPEASTAEAPKAKAKVASAKPRKASRALVLPNAPVERKDELLNRFYIARPSDSAEKLSELMYGNKEKASELKAWNPGSWKTGSLIYYLSPLQPADGEMRSFYTERGMVPTEYEVKRGDTLATIALATYGSKDSWKEIGLLNNIQSPDSVEPGRRIALFPSNLSGYSLKLETTKSAVNTAPLDKQIDSLESQISKLEADIKKEAPASPVVAADNDKGAFEAGVVGSKPLIGDGEHKDLAAIGRERQKGRVTNGGADEDGEADLASSEVASFFKSNLTMILGLVLAFAALGIFMFVRRSRNEHGDV